MGASKQYRWGKTSGGVLLFMIGGCFLLASGCATPQEIFTRKWEKYRDSRDDDARKMAEAIPPKTPPKDFPKSQKKRSWFRWGSESPKVATEKAQADDKKADANSTDKLAKQLAETGKSGKPNAAAKQTDPRLAQAKNTLNSVQPRTNTPAKPAAQSKPLLDVKDPFREELDGKPAAADLAQNNAQPNPANARGKAAAAGLDAPWATHNPGGLTDPKVAAKGANAGTAGSAVDMSGLTEEQIANINSLNAIMSLSEAELAAAVAEARKENAERETMGKKAAEAEIASATEPASSPAADPLDENPFAKFDRERELAKSETTNVEKTVVEEPKGAPIEDENRVEADTLMFRARMALKRNRRDDALRLAEAAEELERTAQIQYSKNEERPSDLVRRLKGVPAAEEGITTASAAVVAGERRHSENPFAAEESLASQTGMSRGSLELARRNVVAEMPPERSSISSTDFLSGNWRDVTSEPADTRIQVANAEQPVREPWHRETHQIVASNRAMSVPSMSAGEGTEASERSGAEGAPAWAHESATDVAPAPPPPSAVCEMPDSEDEADSEPVAREMFDIPEDKPQSAEYPLPLVLGFGLGMAGICGFGFWRRMQSHRFAPRS